MDQIRSPRVRWGEVGMTKTMPLTVIWYLYMEGKYQPVSELKNKIK